MSKKYNRDAFETTNSGNDLHGKGANQQYNTSQSNATKHYDRDSFATSNTGSDLHGQGANQQDSAAQSNATKHYNRDEFEKIILVMIYMIMDQTKKMVNLDKV